MDHLTFAAHHASNKDFISYVYHSGTRDPVILRLLKMVEENAWQDEFDDYYDTPRDVAQELDNVKSDLRSAEELIKDQAEQIKRLETRTVIELLADQEAKLKSALRSKEDYRLQYERERDSRKLAESKLETWHILAN